MVHRIDYGTHMKECSMERIDQMINLPSCGPSEVIVFQIPFNEADDLDSHEHKVWTE